MLLYKYLHLQRKKNFNLAFRDKLYHRRGYGYIAGVDEAGRGPLAGPVVAAAVILSMDNKIRGIRDSKQLTAWKRAELFELILETCLGYGIGVVDAQAIDTINILQATLVAARQAIKQLPVKPDLIVTDNLKLGNCDVLQLHVTKGEWKFKCIAAASIVAKVYRDRLMQFYHQEFPQYDFCHNKGYGSHRHLVALLEHGPTTIHRQTYKGVCWFNDEQAMLKSKRFHALAAKIEHCHSKRGLLHLKAQVDTLNNFLPPREMRQLRVMVSQSLTTYD